MELTAILLEVPQDRRGGGFRKAELRLNGILNPESESISLRVYVGEPSADEATPFEGHPRFVGRAAIMSRERFPESIRKGLLPWADPSTPHIEPDPPINLRFDVTEVLRSLLSSGESPTANVVITDTSNRRLVDELLELEGIELRFYD